MKTTIAILAAAAAGVALAAAPAHAAFGYKAATFKLEVEGVQTNSWSTNHVKQGRCDADMRGQGTEVVRFRSRPAVAHIAVFGGTTPLIRTGKRFGVPFDLDATITRTGVMTVGEGEPCSAGDGTGGEAPRAPDCGTKRSTFYADLTYSTRRKDFIRLEQSIVAPLGPFRRCPAAGRSWPTILDSANYREVGQRLPIADLLGRDRKHIVIATARESRASGDTQYTTTIRYTIALTRIGAVRR